MKFSKRLKEIKSGNFQFATFPRFDETSDTSVDLNVINDEMKLRNLENMYKRNGNKKLLSYKLTHALCISKLKISYD